MNLWRSPRRPDGEQGASGPDGDQQELCEDPEGAQRRPCCGRTRRPALRRRGGQSVSSTDQEGGRGGIGPF